MGLPLRFPVPPMKAVLGQLPCGEGWAFEVKWDGYRTIAHVDGGRLRLQSTAGKDVTARWPELAALAGAVNATSAILDGELVVLDDDGRPRFELVQQSGDGGQREAALYLFDVLSVEGTDTIDLPYEDRRRLLTQLVEQGPNWLVPSHRVGDGEELLALTADQGLEGIVAKRLGSRYVPGTRTRDWVKVKHRRRVEVVIGGFTEGTGNRESTFGALLVGRREQPGGSLGFAGGVGTGFSRVMLERLRALLDERTTATCPFEPPPPSAYRRDATWVRPDLRATLEITEFTNDGLVRQASFVGLVDEPDRPDSTR